MTDTKIVNSKLYFRNFMPKRIINEWLSVDMIVNALFVGLPYSSLPADIQDSVDEEMARRHGPRVQITETLVDKKGVTRYKNPSYPKEIFSEW